jgi:hypothetical protein
MIVLESDHDDVGDLVVLDQRRLHLGGLDVGASTDDHVDAPIGEEQIPVVVEISHVADRREPVGCRLQGGDIPEITTRPQAGPQIDLADLARRDVISVGIEDPNFAAPDRTPNSTGSSGRFAASSAIRGAYLTVST